MSGASFAKCVIGLDIGGTKVRAGLVARDGTVVRATTQRTDISGGRASILASIDTAMAKIVLDGASGAAGIGVSTAGVVDRETGCIVDATPNLPGWKGTALGLHLRSRWGLPTTVENDGKATLVAELWRRPNLRQGTAILLTLGTGLGGAIAIDGKILDGASHVAGHFGMSRSPVRIDGKQMPLEYYVSGAGLARLMPLTDGNAPIDSRSVLAGVCSGDRNAIIARDRWVEKIADLISDLRWTIDPQWLILGGGVVDARNCWWTQLEKRLVEQGIGLRPLPASWGSDAAMVGAAHLAFQATEACA